MPKRSSKKNPGPEDVNQVAFRVVKEALEQKHKPKEDGTDSKNPAAVALGRLGGLKGGKVRAERLSAEQRSEIARTAATKRWQK